jgi:hypothetical protein
MVVAFQSRRSVMSTLLSFTIPGHSAVRQAVARAAPTPATPGSWSVMA